MYLSLLLLPYTILLIYLLLILLKKDRALNEKLPVSLPPLSIVIPFRNESKHLVQLVNSLENQDYNQSFELLLINDNSTDNSLEVLDSIIPHCKLTIRVLQLEFDKNRPITSKQQAIDLGIKEAKNKYIVLSDADMQYDCKWLFSLGSRAAAGADFVFGHSKIIHNNNLFTIFQAFQLEFLFSVAYSFYYAGITGSCMGNNILISRASYLETGGHDSVGYTIVEDRALLNLFKKNKKRIVSTLPFLPLASTYPCSSAKDYYFQLLRWARGGFGKGSNLITTGLIVAFQNILFLFSFFFPFTIETRALTMFNFLITWLYISVCFKKTRSEVSPFYFPFFYLLFTLETILFPVSILLSPGIKWKERTL